MTCGLIGIRRILFHQRYRIRRPEKKAESFTYPSCPMEKIRIFSRIAIGVTVGIGIRLRSACEFPQKFLRYFQWPVSGNSMKHRKQAHIELVLRAGRRAVDGGHSRTFADVNELPAPSSQLAADSRPVRQASPRRFRRGFREDLRRRSESATCCTENTANRLFRENKLRKRGKPSDSQIAREIPRKIARTRRRRRSTTSYGRYVGNSDLFAKANVRVAFSQRFFA